MMVFISTLIADPLGSASFTVPDDSSDTGDIRRRVSRIATLDGGVAVLDSGYSASDRTVRLDVSGISSSTVETLKYICQTYATVRLVLPDGAFLAVPESINTGKSPTLQLLIIDTI